MSPLVLEYRRLVVRSRGVVETTQLSSRTTALFRREDFACRSHMIVWCQVCYVGWKAHAVRYMHVTPTALQPNDVSKLVGQLVTSITNEACLR